MEVDKMTKTEKSKRNKLIADFIRKTYPDDHVYNGVFAYENYYSNSGKTCNSLKFPIYKNLDEIDLSLLENFLKENEISFIKVKAKNNYVPYSKDIINCSIIITFDKEH